MLTDVINNFRYVSSYPGIWSFICHDFCYLRVSIQFWEWKMFNEETIWWTKRVLRLFPAIISIRSHQWGWCWCRSTAPSIADFSNCSAFTKKIKICKPILFHLLSLLLLNLRYFKSRLLYIKFIVFKARYLKHILK